MKTYLSLVALCAFTYFSIDASAQNWVKEMQDPTVNFYTVQQSFNQYWKSKQSETSTEKVKESQDQDAHGEEEEKGGWEVYKRWEYFMTPRVYPTGKRPDPTAAYKVYQHYLQQKATQRNGSGTPAVQSSSWTLLGPTTSIPSYGGGAGRMNFITPNPNNANTLYAGAPAGGLWKSTDGGSTWSTNTDQLAVIGMSDIAFDPTNASTMYLATGDGDGGDTYSIGVLKSTDGGNTWNATGLSYTVNQGHNVNRLLVNPSNANMILAATNTGIYLSTNAGVSWNEAVTGNFKDMEFKPGDPTVVYATTSTGRFYRSSDSGNNFTMITSGLSTSGVGRMAVAVSAANPAYVYVLASNAATGSQDDYGFYGLYRSTDSGQTFTEQSSSPNILGWKSNGNDHGGQGWYDLSLDVSPTNANVVVVGGVNIWRSTNGGVSWSINASWTGYGAPYVHADIHCLRFSSDGTTLYASCDGGVFKTSNNGSSWNDLSNGIQAAEMYSIGVSGSTQNLVISGWQDNGTNLYNGSWQQIYGGDGMTCFIDWSNDNYMYGETYDGDFQRSSNGGGSFTSISSGISETGPWNTKWMIDPNNSQVLYAGLNNVWKSTNRGTSWTQISTWGSSYNSISAITVAPSNSQFIYAASMGGVEMTYNGGSSWQNINHNLPVGSAAITGLAVDPSNPGRVWVTFSGYSTNNKVFMSADSGATWTNISAGLPNLPVDCIVYQKGSADGIYVGTDVGVYYRDNNIGTWISYMNGLPDVIVDDLKIFYGSTPSSDKLRAGTYGRGLWECDLYSTPTAPPTAQFKAFPLSVCTGSSIQFTDQSTNTPSSWAWTLPGGSPSTSTMQNPIVTYDTAGTYDVSLTATNAQGSNSATQTGMVTVYPKPAAPTISRSGNILTCSTTGTYYQWFKNNAIIAGANTQTDSVTQVGIYSVTVTNAEGCSAQSPHFSVSSISSGSGIAENQFDNSISIYPNPNNGKFMLSFDSQTKSNYIISVNNMLGQLIYSRKVNNFDGHYTGAIDLNSYGKGLYILTIEGPKQQYVRKIVTY